MRFITDFADLGVLLPLAVCIGTGLAAAGWRRGAMAWALAVGGTLAVMLALKLMFLGCGSVAAISPSGHTAAGTIIYGGAASLWLRRWIGALPAALCGGGAVASVIGATRIALGAHVPVEVAIGAAVGVGFILLMLRIAGPPPALQRARWLVPVAILVMLLLHGTRLEAEPRLRGFAGWLPASICSELRLR